MKRAVMTAAVVGVLMAGGVGGCLEKQTVQSPDNYMDNIKAQAAEELKKAFTNEVSAFFKSDDLSKTLGLDSAGQAELEESIKTYIDHYSMNEEKLNEAKQSLETFLQNTEGLSAEEIQDRIEGIFKE